MKKILILSALVLGGMATQAQDTGTPTATQDTAHHAHRQWAQRGRMGAGNSPSWGNRGGDRQGPGMDHRGGFGGDRGYAFHRGRSGGFPPVHYTPEQRKQLMSITTEYKRKQEDLYKQDNLTLGAYKTQLVALQKEKKGKMEGLLTPDQKQSVAKWKQSRSENEQVMAAARLERLKIRLQLSDDQEAKLKSQEADFRAHMLTIRSNDDLLPDQKRAQVMALFSKQKDAMASVLTADQLAKWKDMHQGRHFGEGQGGR